MEVVAVGIHDCIAERPVLRWKREGSKEMHKITELKVLEDYKLDLTFADGTSGTVDFSHSPT